MTIAQVRRLLEYRLEPVGLPSRPAQAGTPTAGRLTKRTSSRAARTDDAATHQAVLAERSLLRALQGGCQVPVGASATVHNETLTLRATVLDPDGKKCIQGQIAGTAAQAELLGQQLARELLARGADHLLRHHPA